MNYSGRYDRCFWVKAEVEVEVVEIGNPCVKFAIVLVILQMSVTITQEIQFLIIQVFSLIMIPIMHLMGHTVLVACMLNSHSFNIPIIQAHNHSIKALVLVKALVWYTLIPIKLLQIMELLVVLIPLSHIEDITKALLFLGLVILRFLVKVSLILVIQPIFQKLVKQVQHLQTLLLLLCLLVS